jgi:hypothetical protein
VHVRAVSAAYPGYNAKPVEPTLEDAFLFTMSASRRLIEAVA